MGPGSNMQELDIYYRGSSFFAGLGLQRWIFDADYYYQPGVNRGSSQNYNLLLSASLRAGIALERLEFGGSITYNDNLNRNFIQANTMINVHLELSAKAKL